MKILVFPYDINPYQTLLYTAMHGTYGKDVKVSYAYFLPFIGALHFPLELLVRRLMGYRILHIHWIAFYIPLKIPGQKKFSLWLSRFMIWWIKTLGYRIVWTVHDLLPHDPETADDAAVSRLVAKTAAAKIIHSDVTLDEMQELELDTSNTTIIPHGNYGNVYDNPYSHEQARQKLGLKPDDLVILSFGVLKPYKGIDILAQEISNLNRPGVKLVIAGKCMDENLRLKLQELSNPNIILFDQYVATQDVATFFKAADVVCAPFRAITTSGSILLAITFSKPLVAPRMGALKDIPEEAGMLYNPEDKQALQHSLAHIAEHPEALAAMSKASAAYSKTLDWDGIAAKTYMVYTNMLTRTEQRKETTK